MKEWAVKSASVQGREDGEEKELRVMSFKTELVE